jgi:hypothetical protein
MSRPYAWRGPTQSHIAPIAMRKKTVPATLALLALPTCVCVMSRSSRMIGMSGAAMNVEQNETKNAIQARWKACWSGRLASAKASSRGGHTHRHVRP